jgi:ABC-type branched-subunit amino acid transport system ATPase component
MNLLEVKSLEAGYGRLPILHGIDLHVDEGELVAVIGPNGAGKSTLMRTVAGLLPCWKGQVSFVGNRVHDYEPNLLPTWGLGYVPQERNVFPSLTVAENLEMAATLLKDREPKIKAAYERFPILGQRHKQAGTLSGGERQMLAIASALMLDPKLLMLDEPTTGLAPVVADEVIKQILDINHNGTAILWVVEENPASVLEHCPRVYLLESGQIRRTDSGKNLLNDPKFAELFLGVA